MRVALGIEYDGSSFCGWQTQPSGLAVQDALEAALARVAGEKVATMCAGRTDAGVHASAQVVHFDTSAARPQSAWVRGVNALLPAGVAVLWAREVDAEFHARFCASGRRYRYVLLNRPQRSALFHGKVGWYFHTLDVDPMREAARHLIGRHDFSAFRAAECQAKSPVRQLRELYIERRGDWITFDFHADAFLHHMVRNIVGSLVYVGDGRRAPQWIAEVLRGRERRLAAPTFAPDGLYLTGIEYPAKWNLP
ncbi:MAG: tRNA pseudouridine(38-40) synthase TruA [Pseudomonadota bacterium]